MKIEVKDVKGSLLLARFDGKNAFLFGRDGSGPPFVTQVFLKCSTVDEALESLAPKKVKQALAEGKDVKRQGDWFFIPCNPPLGGSFSPGAYRDLLGNGHNNGIAPGVLYHSWCFYETRHRVEGDIAYRGNGCHYVRGLVRSPDHESLLLLDWHLAVRRNSHNWEHGRRGAKD